MSNIYTDKFNSDKYETVISERKSFPSLYFYSKYIKLVVGASRFAKRGVYNGQRWVETSLGFLDYLEKSGIKFYVEGIENIIQTQGPVVFTSNHMSTLETFVLPSIINPRKKVTFVVKKQLVTYPVFGSVLSARSPILVGRDNPREDLTVVMNEGLEKIKQGISIIIFPQRTRSVKFIPAQYNSLGIKLAKRAGVPVIPVALVTDAWGNGKYLKDFGKIDPEKKALISFGKPLTISGNGSLEHKQSIDFISNKLLEWNRQDCL
jgi:1-acyl-sn-glycerol-3-phosphate acyltransferase